MTVTASERRTFLAHAQDAYIVGDGFPCFCSTCQKVRQEDASKAENSQTNPVSRATEREELPPRKGPGS